MVSRRGELVATCVLKDQTAVGRLRLGYGGWRSRIRGHEVAGSIPGLCSNLAHPLLYIVLGWWAKPFISLDETIH